MIGYSFIDLQSAATLIGWFIIRLMNIQLCTLRHTLKVAISNRELSVSVMYLSNYLQIFPLFGKRLLICLFVLFCLKSYSIWSATVQNAVSAILPKTFFGILTLSRVPVSFCSAACPPSLSETRENAGQSWHKDKMLYMKQGPKWFKMLYLQPKCLKLS